MVPPEVRYADSGGVRIAEQVFGGGPFDIVCAPSHVTHVELVSRTVKDRRRLRHPPRGPWQHRAQRRPGERGLHRVTDVEA